MKWRLDLDHAMRSPGVYHDTAIDRGTGRDVFGCKVIPSRGAWLEFEVDTRGYVGVRVDRKRKHLAEVERDWHDLHGEHGVVHAGSCRAEDRAAPDDTKDATE